MASNRQSRIARAIHTIGGILYRQPKSVGQVSTQTLQTTMNTPDLNPAVAMTVRNELNKRAASGDYTSPSADSSRVTSAPKVTRHR